MTEQTLRAWVDGGLAPAARREVTRWMLRCPDPALPVLLRGLIRERDEARADAALLAAAPELGWLVRAWDRLLQAGRGAWSVGEGLPPRLAVLTVEVGPPLVVSEDSDGVARPALDPGLAGFVVLIVTTDRPSETVLVPPTAARALDPAGLPGWAAEAGDGRTTFWLGLASSPPPAELRALVRAAEAGDVELVAVRWDPPGV